MQYFECYDRFHSTWHQPYAMHPRVYVVFQGKDAICGKTNSNNELRVIEAIDEEVALLIITAFYVENKMKKTTVETRFEYIGLGFPVILLNVPMIEVREIWTPNIS